MQSQISLIHFWSCYVFTGREWDRETGLYYYRARYYDPMEGRFVSKDPIGLDGGMNVYTYTEDNPINFTDPFGLLSYDQIKSQVAANNLSGQSNELITCVCWKESTFNPNGQNPNSSARGLMGVTKAAARDTGYKYSQLYDVGTNIKAGSKYIKLRIKWVGGNVSDGLDGYGTGPGYSANVLSCEKCLKDNPCNYKKCLSIIR